MNAETDRQDAATRAQQALISAQFALFGYICALVGDTQDAQDVLQETNLKLLREQRSYDAARPFLPWAKSIAYFEVLSYRTRKSRDRLALADDAFFEQVAAEADQACDGADTDMAQLEVCLAKLPGFIRELVEARYSQGVPVGALAKGRSCSANAVSLLLFKARRALAECIRERRLAEAGALS